MKKLLLTSILLVIFAFSCQAQTLRIMWTPHPTYDTDEVVKYVVYKWQGDSTAQVAWKIINMDSIGTLQHVKNFSGPYEFLTYFDKTKIIRGGVQAVDVRGRRSDMGLSRFYSKPSDLLEVWIR